MRNRRMVDVRDTTGSLLTEFVSVVRAVVRSDSDLEVRGLWPFALGAVAGLALGLFSLAGVVFEDEKGGAVGAGLLSMGIAMANAGYVLFITRRRSRPRPSPPA